jgi:hypothetical protein
MKIKTMLNAQEFPKNYERNTKPSMTIPDQALSVKDILNRFARGIPVEERTPIYEDVESPDDFLPDPRTLDLAERQQYAEMVQEELNHIRSQAQQSETVGLTKTETEG